jgi:hypothetical protein
MATRQQDLCEGQGGKEKHDDESLSLEDGREDVLEKPPAQVLGPPNSGLKAWLQVLGSFLLFFNSW